MGGFGQRIARGLDVQPGEGRVLVVGAVALFLVEWASVSTTNVAETFFLKRIGVDRLPLVFLVNTLLLAGTSLAIGWLAVRVEQRRLVAIVFGAFAIAIFMLWVFVIGEVRSVFPLLVIVGKQADALAELVFWTALGGIVTGRQAKRLFAPITAGGTLGTICGSFASALIGRTFGIPSLLLVAAAMLGLGAMVALALQTVTLERPLGHAVEPSHHTPSWPDLKSLWSGWLFRVLALSALLAGLLGPMLYFEFSYVADLATQGPAGEQHLLELYAAIRGWMNVGVLGVQVVGTTVLFRAMGVPVAAALSPLIYLLGLAGLCVRTSLAAGVAATAGATLQDHAVYDPAQRILTTLFPERLRTAVTTLVDGAVKRAGAVLGNLIVLAVLATASPAWVGWVGLPIAGLWLVLALVLWRRYPSLLLEVASAGQRDAPAAPSELLDTRTLRALEPSLVGADLARCRAACALVVEAPPQRAVGTLARALCSAPVANRRLLITTLDGILEARPVTSRSAARCVANAFATPDGLTAIDRANLVQTYARLLGTRLGEDDRLLERAAHDECEAVRIAAQAALARMGRGGTVESVLETAHASSDPATRQIVREEVRAELLRAAADPASGAGARLLASLAAGLAAGAERPHAAHAIADVAERHPASMGDVAPLVLGHRHDADARVRAAVLRFVGAVGLASEAEWLAGRLGTRDAAEASAAIRALEALGPAAVEAVCETLRHGHHTARTRAVGVLKRAAGDRDDLRALAGREIDQGLRLLVLAGALTNGGAAHVVVRRMRERVDRSALSALLLLDVLLDDARIGHACKLLRRATTARERAVLLEAIEAVLPSHERERILLLLDDGDATTAVRRASRVLDLPPPSFEDAVGDIVANGDRLTASLLLRTLDGDTLARLDAPTRVAYDPAGEMAMEIDTILHLRSVDLFERLTTQELADLAQMVEEVTVAPGTPIVTEGEFEDCMYVIVDGRVRIAKADVVLRDFGPRDFFGEMALLDGETRSASATAVDTVRLLRLSRGALLEVMEAQPAIAVAVCQTLSRRVRELLEDRARLEPKAAQRNHE